MTLPTKDEAKRAAETLEGPYYPGIHDPARDLIRFNWAIALLKAYAAGELVAREDFGELELLRNRVAELEFYLNPRRGTEEHG